MSDTYEEGEPGRLSVEMGLTTEWVPVIVLRMNGEMIPMDTEDASAHAREILATCALTDQFASEIVGLDPEQIQQKVYDLQAKLAGSAVEHAQKQQFRGSAPLN
jgi:hypothetical protein